MPLPACAELVLFIHVCTPPRQGTGGGHGAEEYLIGLGINRGPPQYQQGPAPVSTGAPPQYQQGPAPVYAHARAAATSPVDGYMHTTLSYPLRRGLVLLLIMYVWRGVVSRC